MPSLKNLAADWLSRLQARGAKPASLRTFASFVQNHIDPLIGDLEVETFSGKQLKAFTSMLLAKDGDDKLSPNSIRKIVSTVPLIIKSEEDEDCNPRFLRTWNMKSILEMVPDVDAQQPTISAKRLKNALKFTGAHTDRYRIIVALLAATGIRVGELLALRASDDGEHSGWSQENSALEIRTSMWDGEEQLPKTKAAIRTVDLSEPVNAMVAAYVKNANKKSGDRLFSTRTGTPYRPASLQELALAPFGVPGAHSLRRWRVTHLRTAGCPETLVKYWLGHAKPGGITALYDKSTDNASWRQQQANQLGIGFDLPVSPTPNRIEKMLAANDALPSTYVATDSDLPEVMFA